MKPTFKIVLTVMGMALLFSCGGSENNESSDDSKGMAGENTYDTSRIQADTLTPQETVQDTFPGEPVKKDTLK